MLHNYDFTISSDTDVDKISGSTEELQKNGTILDGDDLEYADDYYYDSESDDNIDIQLVVVERSKHHKNRSTSKHDDIASEYVVENLPIQKTRNMFSFLPHYRIYPNVIKRLICYSLINKEACRYGDDCTYAHTLEEQTVDTEKMFIYQVLLDKNLMCFFSVTNPKTEEIYQELIFLTKLCKNCLSDRCTGGYNCRHGAHTACLKICRCDLFTGQCENSVKKIHVPNEIITKIKDAADTNNSEFSVPEYYLGCNNGHHLSSRNIVPYLKYHHQMEQMSRFPYQSDTHSDLIDFNQDAISTELNGMNMELDGLEELCKELDEWKNVEKSIMPPEEIS